MYVQLIQWPLYFKTHYKTAYFVPKERFGVLSNLYFKTTCSVRPHFHGLMSSLWISQHNASRWVAGGAGLSCWWCGFSNANASRWVAGGAGLTCWWCGFPNTNTSIWVCIRCHLCPIIKLSAQRKRLLHRFYAHYITDCNVTYKLIVIVTYKLYAQSVNGIVNCHCA